MKLMSVDIETTGLDYRTHGIIELGAVAFELGNDTPVDFFRCDVFPEGMVWSQYCLKLHEQWIGRINQEVAEKRFQGAMNYSELYGKFRQWAFKLGFYTIEAGRVDNKPSKPTAAGKCFGTFDANFLNFRFNEEPFRKRVMDPAHYYMNFREDGDMMPDLPTCKKRAMDTGCTIIKRAEVRHNALDDAYDVMHLLNHAFNKGWMSGYEGI